LAAHGAAPRCLFPGARLKLFALLFEDGFAAELDLVAFER
jgi:hypothetical protein